jgi:DNA-binding response OmpR family regulator
MDSESTKVLFITADPVLEAVYRLRLEMDEYEVTWCNPIAAFDALSAVNPDLIYIDLDSLDVGPRLVEGIRSQTASDVPLVLVSRKPEELVRQALPRSAQPVFVVSLAHPTAAVV